MEGGGAGGGNGGGGGPAPFLLKTYEMVDDPLSNDIVSWSNVETSFVVWNPPDFAARLLPTYFKHNNFSSFIRQLNTYGFRKIDPERWEFANDFFIKGQKQLLKSIHRRKPIHSHSHPPAGGGGPLPDPERAALEEEIERLTRERAGLQADLWRFKQQQSGAKIQIDDLERRILDMEQRQLKMVAFLHKAMANPKFMDNLVKMANGLPGPALPDSSSIDSIPKKRRLPGLENESNNNNSCSFYDDHSSTSTSRPDLGNLLNQSFCDKLKLELCPAMADSENLVTVSTQSSNEEDDNVGPHVRLADTGTTSLCPLRNALLNEDRLFPCLSLALASTSSLEMQIDRNQNLNQTQNQNADAIISSVEEDPIGKGNGNDLDRVVGNDRQDNNGPDSCDETANREGQVAPPERVNDVFWEQFLTERPGCTDNEEASSSLRPNPSGEILENGEQGNGDMEKLKL